MWEELDGWEKNYFLAGVVSTKLFKKPEKAPCPTNTKDHLYTTICNWYIEIDSKQNRL